MEENFIQFELRQHGLANIYVQVNNTRDSGKACIPLFKWLNDSRMVNCVAYPVNIANDQRGGNMFVIRPIDQVHVVLTYVEQPIPFSGQ